MLKEMIHGYACGTRVVWKGQRGSICYRLTEGKAYTVTQDTMQDVWEYANGIPFYPTPLVHVIDDNGNPYARHINYWSLVKEEEETNQ